MRWLIEQCRHIVSLLQINEAIWSLCQSEFAGVVMYDVSLNQLFEHLTCLDFVSVILSASIAELPQGTMIIRISRAVFCRTFTSLPVTHVVVQSGWGSPISAELDLRPP